MVETMSLTAPAADKLKPSNKLRWIRDASSTSLYLVIAPRQQDGKKRQDSDNNKRKRERNPKSWMMRFRDGTGRPRKMVLGPYDSSGHELKDTPEIGQPLSLAAARALAAEIHRRRMRGEDVVGEHKARKIRRRTEAAKKSALAFGACVIEFFRDYKTRRWHTRPRRWHQDARTLGLSWPRDADPAKVEPEIIRGGLAEAWAAKPVAEIDEADVLAIVDAARKAGIPGLDQRNGGASEARGRRMHAALSVFFRWLQTKRRVLRNICRDVSHSSAPPARTRVLTADELRWAWHACDAEPLYGPVVKLLICTGQRLNECAALRKTELTDDKALWTIPASRAKNHREHIVPLTMLVRAQIPPASGDLVFSTTGTTAVSGWGRLKRRIDRRMAELARQERGAKVAIPPWRFHDLRRVAVTGMGELGIRGEVIERVINHQSGTRAGVAGTYNLAEMLPERRDALESWSRYVTLVIDRNLYRAHEVFIANDDDDARKDARKAFRDAVAAGGDRWSRYLKTLAGESNVATLVKARARRGRAT
jgi:integrase